MVDESTGSSVVEYLRQVGHDVAAVAEALPQADDSTILEQAFAELRFLVTNDKDFGALVFRGRRAHRGVLLLRLRDESPANRVRVVKTVLEQYGDRLAGHFVVATDTRVRIRPASGSS